MTVMTIMERIKMGKWQELTPPPPPPKKKDNDKQINSKYENKKLLIENAQNISGM